MYSGLILFALATHLVAITTVVDADSPYDDFLSGILTFFNKFCSSFWSLYARPKTCPPPATPKRQGPKHLSSEVPSHKRSPSTISSTSHLLEAPNQNGPQALAAKKSIAPAKSSAGQRFLNSGIRRPLRAPVSKGHYGAVHLGDHKNCPTFFKIGGNKFALMENGDVFLIDEGGHRHSMTELYGGTETRFPIPAERTMLCFDQQGLLCECDPKSAPRQVETWCWDDPASSSPQEVSGMGCFFSNSSLYQKEDYLSGLSDIYAPLSASLHGSNFFGSGSSRFCVDPVHVGRVELSQLEDSPLAAGSTPGHSGASSSQSPQPVAESSYNATLPAPGGHTALARRTCSICSRVMRRPSALATHINMHKGIKPFECGKDDCDYASTTKANLERHVRAKHNNHSH